MNATSDGVIHPFNATTEGRHGSMLGTPIEAYLRMLGIRHIYCAHHHTRT
jgi:hypothetical protein